MPGAADSEDHLEALAAAAADAIASYPFRCWAFGEEIALLALLEASDVLQQRSLGRFVERLVGTWAASHETYVSADHIAAGQAMLELDRRTGDPGFYAAATKLGTLFKTLPIQHGVPIHRPDLAEFATTIWVDCLALDAPFLFRLAQASGEPAWARIGRYHLQSYVHALKDPSTGLYSHGYDATTRIQSPVHWGRGNAWALTGLATALEHAPNEDPELRTYLETETHNLARSMAALQDETGHWHTVIDDPSSPLEASVAAFYAATLFRAFRIGLVAPADDLDFAAHAAMRAVLHEISTDGLLPVSSATPIGKPAAYVDHRSTGIYPWGQGPALLALCEAIRSGGR